MNRFNFKEISKNPCCLCRYYKMDYLNGIIFKFCVFGGSPMFGITNISGCDEFIRKYYENNFI